MDMITKSWLGVAGSRNQGGPTGQLPPPEISKNMFIC